MGLEFGNDKCVKKHIGKKHQKQICPDLYVDCWKEKLVIETNQRKKLVDVYMGEEEMKNVTEKIYLGDIILCDGRNNKNIKEKTDKTLGNVNKIISTLNERPYGRHIF